MSVGRRRRKAAERIAAEARRSAERKLASKLRMCWNCGEPGPHFVPPSFGDPGFYICEKKEVQVDDLPSDQLGT